MAEQEQIMLQCFAKAETGIHQQPTDFEYVRV